MVRGNPNPNQFRKVSAECCLLIITSTGCLTVLKMKQICEFQSHQNALHQVQIGENSTAPKSLVKVHFWTGWLSYGLIFFGQASDFSTGPQIEWVYFTFDPLRTYIHQRKIPSDESSNEQLEQHTNELETESIWNNGMYLIRVIAVIGLFGYFIPHFNLVRC